MIKMIMIMKDKELLNLKEQNYKKFKRFEHIRIKNSTCKKREAKNKTRKI